MVRKFLASYSNNGRSDTLGLQLFDLLVKRRRKLSNRDCSVILFGADEKNRIRVLKSRLKHRILDALTTDLILENQQYDNDVKLSIQLKKKLAQFQTLFYSKKTNLKIIISLLEDVIIKATKYELFSILIEALIMKKVVVGFKAGLKEYDEIDLATVSATNSNMTKTNIMNNYYRILLSYRTDHTSRSIRALLKKSINEGEQLLKKGDSKIGRYYMNIIKYAYYLELKNYKLAANSMKDQVILLTGSEVVYRTERLGATYDYLCEIELKNGEYEMAASYAEKAVSCFKKGEMNYTVARELAFRSCLYAQQVDKAEKAVKDMIRYYDNPFDKHRTSTHRFFLANLYFAKKDFRRCSRMLAEPYEFNKDKTGWEFNLKMLSIMCLVEQNKIDDAYEMLVNYTRILIRNKLKGELNERNHTILALLEKWLSDGANSSIVKLKRLELWKKLNSGGLDWDPLKSELIPFHQWISDKIS